MLTSGLPDGSNTGSLFGSRRAVLFTRMTPGKSKKFAPWSCNILVTIANQKSSLNKYHNHHTFLCGIREIRMISSSEIRRGRWSYKTGSFISLTSVDGAPIISGITKTKKKNEKSNTLTKSRC